MVAEVEIIMTAFRELVVREWRGWKLDLKKISCEKLNAMEVL
jgi:hypothetical protein